MTNSNIESIRYQLKEYIDYLKYLQQNETLLGNDFENIQNNMILFGQFRNENYPQDIEQLFQDLHYQFSKTMKTILQNEQNQVEIEKHKNVLKNLKESEIYFSDYQTNSPQHIQSVRENWQVIYQKIEQINQNLQTPKTLSQNSINFSEMIQQIIDMMSQLIQQQQKNLTQEQNNLLTNLIYQLDQIEYQHANVNSNTDEKMNQINKFLNQLIQLSSTENEIIEEFYFKNKQKQSQISKEFSQIIKDYETPQEFYQFAKDEQKSTQNPNFDFDKNLLSQDTLSNISEKKNTKQEQILEEDFFNQVKTSDNESVYDQGVALQQKMYLQEEIKIEKKSLDGDKFVNKNNQNYFPLKAQKLLNKFQKQNYQYKEYLTHKFRDPNFPPMIYSIKKPNSDNRELQFCQWKRISFIYNYKIDIIFKTIPCDLSEAIYSNKYLLQILSVLYLIENFDQQFLQNYDQEKGTIEVRCLTDNTLIVMDDFIPIQLNVFSTANYNDFTVPFIPPFIHQQTSLNIFYSIIEKYAAKIFGSYEKLQQASFNDLLKLFSTDISQYELNSIKNFDFEKQKYFFENLGQNKNTLIFISSLRGEIFSLQNFYVQDNNIIFRLIKIIKIYEFPLESIIQHFQSIFIVNIGNDNDSSHDSQIISIINFLIKNNYDQQPIIQSNLKTSIFTLLLKYQKYFFQKRLLNKYLINQKIHEKEYLLIISLIISFLLYSFIYSSISLSIISTNNSSLTGDFKF